MYAFSMRIHLGIHRLCFFWRESYLMYSFSIRQFIWEYIGDFIFWRESYLMYSFSIRQFIWEYIGVFLEKFWSAKKSTRLKWSISLLNPFKKCQKTIAQRG